MDWNDIPQELLDLILSNVFAKDRYNFSLVCRSWNEVVSASSYRHSPCLMFNERSMKHLWKFFQHNSFFYLDFPKLEGARIRFSNHGWLLMSRDNDETLFFYDPFNHHMIELPALCFKDRVAAYSTICFFHPPTSPDCFIVGIGTIIEQRYDEAEIGVLKHGEDEWKIYIYETPHEFQATLGPPILDDGLLYFLDLKGNIATFDISKHGYNLAWSVFTGCLKPRQLRKNIREHFLIKPKGEKEIFAVFAIYSERRVSVYRLSKGLSWEFVEDLGDKVFYLCRTSSFGYTTDVKSMANKIFFPKFYGDKIIYYSLDTKKYHCFEGDYSSNNSNGLGGLGCVTWMVPTSGDTQHPKESLEWCPQVDQTTTTI
ncbi:hypothetical protein ABFX02_03G061800 [Erythranthe guttata]